MLLFFLYTMADSALSQFKSWIFPGLVSILGMMIWNDVNEIKADVKALMAQSNIDKTRIDNLEREVYKTSSYKMPFPTDFPPKEIKIRPVAIMNKDEDEDVDRKDI
jgi:hypothetical protein